MGGRYGAEMTIANELNDGAEGITQPPGRMDVSERTDGDAWRPFADLEADLKILSGVGRRRALERLGGRDFASNDYLGLAQSVELRGAAAGAGNRQGPGGAGGWRLLRGNPWEDEAFGEGAEA